MTHDKMRRAIAKSQGINVCPDCDGSGAIHYDVGENCGWMETCPSNCQGSTIPPYTTSIDAIQAAALERFKDALDAEEFRWALETVRQTRYKKCFRWHLTARDWCEAYLRTLGRWTS